MTGPVVVGVDTIDTSHGAALLEFAAREAHLRDTALWLVHAYQWIPPVAFGVGAGAEAEQAMREAAVALLNQAAAIVRADHPNLHLETAPVSGSAASSLADICPTASLVVVGGRGRGGFAGQLLGSVALTVLSHARCPVVVVRGDMHGSTRPVVIGVDVEAPATGSEVLDFAFSEASLRHVGVHAVHACDWQGYVTVTAERQEPEQLHFIDSDRRRALDAILEPWADKYPDVGAAAADVFPTSPSKALVDSTGMAGLIVHGAKAHGQGHDRVRLGALAHTVLHHARCPVVIVPEH
jgi:nucleotide-binding universal stress UspA family protein